MPDLAVVSLVALHRASVVSIPAILTILSIDAATAAAAAFVDTGYCGQYKLIAFDIQCKTL